MLDLAHTYKKKLIYSYTIVYRSYTNVIALKKKKVTVCFLMGQVVTMGTCSVLKCIEEYICNEKQDCVQIMFAKGRKISVKFG